jgi:sugar/nucleoside kinase (ribokinase family)
MKARTFRYTTRVQETLPEHLATADSSYMLRARYFHFFCHANDIPYRVQHILDRRTALAVPNRPFIVWEPSTATYNPAQLQTCLEAVKSVDVFSPNHVEFLSLFGLPEDGFDKILLEKNASQFLKAGVGPKDEGAVVIRAAQHGCLIMSRSVAPIWLPAYYQPGSEKIVDTTGAGNAFLGGFVVGHSETGDIVEAAQYGSVAASFLVEQVGPPTLRKECSVEAGEMWNSDNPQNRLGVCKQRLQSH